MIKTPVLFAYALLLLFMACNNQPKPTADNQDARPHKPGIEDAFTPYKARLVGLTVQDFDKWYAQLRGHDSLYNAYGLTNPGIGRELEDDKKILILADVADIQKAKDYSNSAARKEAMKRSGVIDATEATYWNVIMHDTTTIPQKERVMVTHPVKDFDAWKKAFDAEGTEARAANGLVERIMARGLDDSNMVAVFFAITDMEKAKARIAAPELKKIMTDGGVEGTPQITWFRWVD